MDEIKSNSEDIIQIGNEKFVPLLTEKDIQKTIPNTITEGEYPRVLQRLDGNEAMKKYEELQSFYMNSAWEEIYELAERSVPESEFILEVSLIQKEDTDMLSKGHEIAWDQFVLNKGINTPSFSEKSELFITKSDSNIEINNESISLSINAKSGEINSWVIDGKEITNQPIKPNFWRPPTDNDLGNGMDKWAKVWQDATYNYSAELIQKPILKNQYVVFDIDYKLPNDIATVTATYTIIKNGTVQVTLNYEPNQKDLPNLPRLGMYLTLNNNFQDVLWYGKGPSESYWDRKSGQKIGKYSGEILNQFERYPRPQETGNKSDLRWIEVSSNELKLKAYGYAHLNSSVWPFGMSELDFSSEDAGKSASGLVPVTKKHGADIKIGETIQWNIDYMQMGVGGDTSWGRLVHPEYTIDANKPYTYSFTIQPSTND